MELTLFNTLTRKKETFQPITPGKAGIYTCGPTVYAPAHIGNLRSYIFPDLLKKVLRTLGYEVLHVINVTDVGHLTSDADEGEDKLEKAARQSSRSAWEIAKEYTDRYLADLARLNIVPPDVLPKATEHIEEQVEMISTLEAKGFTYATQDGIYFDTGKLSDYGHLARLKAEGLQEGSRVEMADKRNKTDFALWKFSPEGVQRQMEWDSPWGRGFPGWHIECSAMSMKYLGQRFDIHTGGTDHIPVHHTNEIAQSEAATGEPFVNYWLHGEYLVLGESKRMGKSEGNMLTLDDLIEGGIDPLSFRYLALNSHYRSFLNFTDEGLKGAQTALKGLRKLVLEAGGEEGKPPVSDHPPTEAAQTMLAELADDLNAPKALGTLWTVLRDGDISNADKLALAGYAESLMSLGLFQFASLTETVDVPPEVEELARQRWAARKAKDFAESDRLRDEISKAGFVVRDSRDGYEVVPAE